MIAQPHTRPFRWEKLGQVYQPPFDGGWRHSYGQGAVTIRLPDRRRVFFSVRPLRGADGLYKANVCWIDVAADDPSRILNVADGPMLTYGPPGAFDEHGLMPSSAVWAGETMRMYYCGWMRLAGVPYAVSIGLAESHDGGATFVKAGSGPLFSRTLAEPFQENGPCVVATTEGQWHMLYGSGTDWIDDGGAFEAIYVIKQARSADGIRWERSGDAAIAPVVDHECQAFPSILRLHERWHVWFSYRYGLNFRNAERGYRIGYAWSDDLRTWQRDDALGGIGPSADGWDSQTVCYPCVFAERDDVYMYYNGNDFGEHGFGLARLIRG